jgi:LmbE family N-acetylglucosaminyl deacetylase
MMFLDFEKLERSNRIDLLFPGWKRGEKVAFYSPHDDDAALGAGYLIRATIEAGGTPHLLIFCRGDAGYSTLSEKKGLAGRRKKEAAAAYGPLGLSRQSIHFFDIPDFSLRSRLDRLLLTGKGLFEKVLRLLRREQVSRVVFSSGYLEHWDHTAAYDMGVYFSSQAQDPILADLGNPCPMKTYLAYSVWGDFEPPAERGDLSADLGILATAEEENNVMAAIGSFSTQAKVIKDIVARRKKRRTEEGYLELYKVVRVRKPIDFSSYFDLLKRM